jgi:hypothetical protein
MSDDPSETALDHRLISLDEPYEIRDWCAAFRCSKEDLKRAVKAVGHSAEEVREFLGSGRT